MSETDVFKSNLKQTNLIYKVFADNADFISFITNIVLWDGQY
ncbi:hypothetical protein DFR47_101921 [Pseudochrobactrum asaccharolyticum]|jgi:hypothetical protein|uniref:Uncharacterized protein n=1 Tax=Pseudochrobactrum asaccharolyticum TaxID=354351 RepID=A0A366EAB2_9HYPH|nr:hypothetical protein DFR47_101921 [Pseudochrobactrum asaccharolyticum]